MGRIISLLSFCVGLAVVTIGVSKVTAGSIGTNGTVHVREMKSRADGQFDIVCIDGEVEVKTSAEVQAGQVCMHIKTQASLWTLASGGVSDGMRLCDMNITYLSGKNRVLNLEVRLAAPCSGDIERSEDCNGWLCSVRLGGGFFSFDFSVPNQLGVTRLKDGLKAQFSGKSSGGGGGGNNGAPIRINTVNGVDRILQATNDGGATWLSVCDDGFNDVAAQVACRELGYSSLLTRAVGVMVSGDQNYGIDQISCDGTESSIFDCEHEPWADEDCGPGEHIQLECQ